MSQTTTRLAIVAIVIGLIGAFGLRSLLMEDKPVPPTAPDRTSVPRASADLPTDRVIEMGDIALVPMTAQQMREEIPHLEEVMLGADQIIGRRLKGALKKGEPFRTTDMYLEGQRPDMVSKLKEGDVAALLQLPDARGGAVPTGSVVDVIFRSNERAGDETSPRIPETTVLLLQKVTVLDVQRPRPAAARTGREPLDVRFSNARLSPPMNTVTLGVSAKQAAALSAVEGRGELSLVLRRPGDPTVDSRGPVTLESLLGISPAGLPFVTIISRRGSRQSNVFERYRQPANY